MTTAKLRRAQAAMGQPETHVSALCRELGVTRQTLYRYVGPKGELRRYPLHLPLHPQRCRRLAQDGGVAFGVQGCR